MEGRIRHARPTRLALALVGALAITILVDVRPAHAISPGCAAWDALPDGPSATVEALFSSGDRVSVHMQVSTGSVSLRLNAHANGGESIGITFGSGEIEPFIQAESSLPYVASATATGTAVFTNYRCVPGNHVSNGEFELDTARWKAKRGTELTHDVLEESPTGVHRWEGSARLERRRGTGAVVISDVGDSVLSTTDGHGCQASAWVKGSSGNEVNLQLRERDEGVVARDNHSQILNGDWQLLVTSLVVGDGHRLGLDIVGRGFAEGEVLNVDTVGLFCGTG